MQIIYRMAIELTRRSALAPLDAVQGDGNTRAVKISLLENGAPWEVPAGVTAAVAFRKPDGHKGLYDTLPDGTKAVTIDGSAVTAVLAPQVLSCAGNVSASVVFYDADLQQLATFPFTIRVEANPAAGKELSNDYYRYSTMEDVSRAVEEALASLETEKQAFLEKAEEALAVVHDTATADAPAIVCEAMGTPIAVADAAQRPLPGLILYGKTVQNGTPTPENPVPLESVGAGGAINTTVAGKNLIKLEPNIATKAMDIVFSASNGGTRLCGTSTRAYAQNSHTEYNPLELPAGKYTLKMQVEGTTDGATFGVMITRDGVNWGEAQGQRTGEKTFTIEDGQRYGIFVYLLQSGKTVDCVVKAMLVPGTEAAEWEPYKEPQTLSTSTPNGLPGIPVSSGGNYTDENGQRWICDEIDFARGLYVQRVKKVVFDGTNYVPIANTSLGSYMRCGFSFANDNLAGVFSQNGLYSHGKYLMSYSEDSPHGYVDENMMWLFLPTPTISEAIAYLEEQYAAGMPVTILYRLATPIETPLSAEEMAQYAALHSNKPNTTVLNDAGAGMKLSYVADTKIYIDQKLAAISAALLNT